MGGEVNRLQAQYQRLYLRFDPPAQGTDAQPSQDPSDQHPAQSTDQPDQPVRALVLALRKPADWDTLAPLWRGVQTDWAWPAPAIAVNGADAFELWFSLAQPVPRAEAAALLHQLCQRYLPNVKPERLPRWPSLHAAALAAPLSAALSAPLSAPLSASLPALPALPAPEAGRIPALHPDTGRWSAFVAPDLPAVFGDDPSLDFPPNEDAQAELLSRLGSIQPDDWRAALAALQPAQAVASVAPVALPVVPAVAGAVTVVSAVPPVPPPVAAPAMEAAHAVSPHHAALVGPYEDPRQFLRDVMNDSSVPLALRLEAAKALLG
jgi:hypothetical protein